MSDKFCIRALDIARAVIEKKLDKAKVIVDATCGNGHDTLFLALNAPADARIIALDIQKKAVHNTIQRLAENGLRNVEVYCDSHENTARYTRSIDLAVFNLGYLPGGDHTIVSQCAVTVRTIGKVAGLLGKDGVIVIVGYPGHGEGAAECLALEAVLEKFPQREYNCACLSMRNQVNNPPRLYLIEKR